MFLTGLMMVLNEEEFLEENLDTHLPQVDALLVAEGGTVFAEKAGMCGPKGESTDKTRELLLSHEQDLFDLVLAEQLWSHKQEMWNCLLQKIPDPTTHVALIDADEFWFGDSLRRATTFFAESEGGTGKVKLRHWSGFYKNDPDRFLLHGYPWDGFFQKLYRWSPKQYFTTEVRSPLVMVDEHGRTLTPVITIAKEDMIPDHYGFCRDKKRHAEKQRYYLHRGF